MPSRRKGETDEQYRARLRTYNRDYQKERRVHGGQCVRVADRDGRRRQSSIPEEFRPMYEELSRKVGRAKASQLVKEHADIMARRRRLANDSAARQSR
jgi:hypothetical protein